MEIKWNKSPKEILNRIFDDETMTYVHTRLWERCGKWYTPMDSGTLNGNVEVSAECVHYKEPYAHYQWAGEVYGPNIPIYKDGVLTGFISPPKKHPTGGKLHYSKDKHPLASSHWEKAMMVSEGDEFCKDIEDYLRRK